MIGPDKGDVPPIEIILVHGTFAADAAWIRPEESSLCKCLLKSVRRPIVFTQLSWTGANTVSARSNAALRLRERISSSREPLNITLLSVRDDSCFEGCSA